MHSRFLLASLVISFVIASVWMTDATVADESSKSDSSQPVIVEDSMHEFMEYVFQPTYRRLKVAMAEAPAENKGWKAIKSDSLILAESCNLLFARVPEKDAADWNRHSAASRDAGAELYKGAREKKFEVASAAWKKMLDNCNACHRQFEDGKHILTP
ncbi:MAG: hypothetical protein AB8B91_04870 [Rubripirellula sp.]